MKILITGSNGFIGKNLISVLTTVSAYNLFFADKETHESDLYQWCSKCDLVINLAGTNRSEIKDDFFQGNVEYIKHITDILVSTGNLVPIISISSIHISNIASNYGSTKKLGEEILMSYSKKNNQDVIIYRLSNVFGKWGRPNYNSVVATFCHNISREIPIKIDNPQTEIDLIYIDDLITDILESIEYLLTNHSGEYFIKDVRNKHKICIGELASKINQFWIQRNSNFLPMVFKDSFDNKLYSTFISYLPKESIKTAIIKHEDHRGSFTELFRSDYHGQISFNVVKPGVTKGNHWHKSKTEKFIVIKGKARILMRHIVTDDLIEFTVDDKIISIIDILPGYTHNIRNIGSDDLIFIIWCNENFDKDKPDTYIMEV